MQHYFNDKHFRLFSRFLRENYGINFSREKADMLKTKLNKLMAKNNISSYDRYYELICRCDNMEYLTQFLDEITVHTTDFFRENNHFEYLKKNMGSILGRNKRVISNGEIRAWSMACSTGEEPYTLAMVLKEILPNSINIKILATDISKKAVAVALKGEYALGVEGGLKRHYIRKYFIKSDGIYRINDDIKDLVTLRLFNLMEPYKFKKNFDLIFCRNVLIYFEQKVQTRLIEKIYDSLVPGGLLFLGHSEGWADKERILKYIQPSIYMKA